MPLTAFGLLLMAAVLHTGWNLLIKGAKEKQVFTWWSLIIGSVCFAPVFVLSSPLPLSIWPYVAVTVLVEVIYYTTLTRAYEHGDFSLIYPIARGAAPALLAFWAVLFLGERPRPFGVAGLVLLVLGLIVTGGKAWWLSRKASTVSTSGVILALCVACCISMYSAIDGAAVRLVPPAPYTVLVLGLTAALVAPAMVVRYGRYAIATEWRTNWPRIVAVGILMLLAYMLVLQTYSMARVSYAGAIREISVVFAAFLGWRWLGEEFGITRTMSALLIFAGILMIALAG